MYKMRVLSFAVKKYLSSPVFEGDEEKTRVARVLNATLLSIDLLLIVTSLLGLLFFGNKRDSLILIGAIFIVIYLVRLLMNRGKVQLAGILGSTFLWFIATFLTAMSGGLNTNASVFYLVGTVMAGLMLGPAAAGSFSVLSILAVLAMTILEANGHALPNLFPSPPLARVISFSLALFLTTMAVSINLVSLKNALGMARNELKERRSIENELRLSEYRYKSLFESANLPILLIDADKLEVIGSNSAATALYGYNTKEFLQLSSIDLEPKQDLPGPINREENNPHQFCYHRKKDGTIFPVELTTGALSITDQKIVMLFINDISERRQRETEMEAIVAIGAAMRHAPNRHDLLVIILQQIMDMLGVDATALVVYDPYTRKMIVELGCGRFESATGQRAATDLDIQSISVTKDLTREAQSNPLTSLLSNLSILGTIPFVDCNLLINQDETLGMLLIGRKTPMTVQQDRLLTSISEISASALKRTTLFEETTNYARQMSIASEMGLMLGQSIDLPKLYAQASKSIFAMYPDACGLLVSLFDVPSQTFSCIYAFTDNEELDIATIPRIPLGPPGKGTQSQVVHTRRPLIIADLQAARQNMQKSMIIGDTAGVPQSALYVPMLAQDKIIGVVNLQSYQLNRYSQNDAELLTLVSSTFAVAIENARLFNGLRQSNTELSEAYDATISGWSKALDLRDMETEGHSQRVADLTVRLSHALGLSEKEIVQIRRGALLHDIGKIGVPDHILLKHGPLNDEEWIQMRMHPVYAYEMLRSIEFLSGALEIPYGHHEKWDGSGYPLGLKEEEIPLSARIFAIVDVWDALTSDRPYRACWPKLKSIAHIQSQSGIHFDPTVLSAFMKLLTEDSELVAEGIDESLQQD